jgi:hypothetical protein
MSRCQREGSEFNSRWLLFMPTETEVAWAAGFFDGEGNCAYYPDCRHFRMTIEQASVEKPAVLVRFRKIVGCGRIGGPYTPPSRKKNWTPVWRIACHNAADVQKVMDLLYPYLSSTKRKQYRQALSSFKKRDGRRNRVCI